MQNWLCSFLSHIFLPFLRLSSQKESDRCQCWWKGRGTYGWEQKEGGNVTSDDKLVCLERSCAVTCTSLWFLPCWLELCVTCSVEKKYIPLQMKPWNQAEQVLQVSLCVPREVSKNSKCLKCSCLNCSTFLFFIWKMKILILTCLRILVKKKLHLWSTSYSKNNIKTQEKIKYIFI